MGGFRGLGFRVWGLVKGNYRWGVYRVYRASLGLLEGI